MLKRAAAASIIVAVVLASAWGLQVVVGDDGGPQIVSPAASLVAPIPSASSSAEALCRVVTGMRGRVERRGADGHWRPVTVGMELSPDDHVRTFEDSSATIDLGLAVTITVAESTVVGMGTVSRSLSRVRLDDGRVASVVRDTDGFRFRVEVRGVDVHADAAAGAFVVMSRQEGHATVVATRGAVELTAAGRSVTVDDGKSAVVAPGQPPSTPFDIPPSLFLHLGPAPTPREQSVTVEGTTTPGATVNIGGNLTTASLNGEFRREVELVQGENRIVVEVTDALGRRATEALPRITVTPPLAPPTGEVEW